MVKFIVRVRRVGTKNNYLLLFIYLFISSLVGNNVANITMQIYNQ